MPIIRKGMFFRASAKSLLALVYATIGSASMESGRVMVKGGPGKVTNPDGTESALMPQEIWHDKIRLPGYEEFDSQEYYRLAKEKAGEVITEGECTLAASQKDLWALSNKNGPEFLFCLQTYPDGDNLSGNYLSESYYGYWDDDGTMGKGYYTYVTIGYKCLMIGMMNALPGESYTVILVLTIQKLEFILGITIR